MNAPKIAVVVHCFYADLMEALIASLKHIPFEFDLYVSISAETNETVRSLLSRSFPDKKIVLRTVPNRGFDIAPFVCEFREVYVAYDLVLKVHTKKSSHTPWLKAWGSYLLENVSGSPEIVASILRMFSEDTRLGLVYPEIIPPLRSELTKDPWQENWGSCRELAARLDIPLQKKMALDFPAGSIYWFRPEALEALFKLGLTSGDFPEGSRIRRNGTLAHAVERLMVLIAQKSGFSSRTVCFEPYKTVRDMSFLGRLRNRVCCEWQRLMDRLGRT